MIARAKDAKGTQTTHGFKISGMSVHHPESPRTMDKKACAAASQDMAAFLASFADNGANPASAACR